MKFGINVPIHGAYGDPHLLLDLALEAEKSGWDGFFVWDHIATSLKNQPMIDPWIVLSSIATHTDKIRLGTMITPLARRRPWKLARETVALDHLSNGRLILGVGLGASAKTEFASFGEEGDPKVRAAKLDEGLEILSLLWSGEKVSYSGEHYTLSDVHFLPRPIQQPRIPVWVGGYWPHKRPMRRAAQWDGAFPLQSGYGAKRMMPPETVREIRAFLREVRVNDSAIDLIHWGLSSGDPAQDDPVFHEYADAGVTWWLESLTSGRGSIEKMRERITLGPPAW